MSASRPILLVHARTELSRHMGRIGTTVTVDGDLLNARNVIAVVTLLIPLRRKQLFQGAYGEPGRYLGIGRPVVSAKLFCVEAGDRLPPAGVIPRDPSNTVVSLGRATCNSVGGTAQRGACFLQLLGLLRRVERTAGVMSYPLTRPTHQDSLCDGPNRAKLRRRCPASQHPRLDLLRQWPQAPRTSRLLPARAQPRSAAAHQDQGR